MAAETLASIWLAAAKIASYVAALLVIGASGLLTLVLPRWPLRGGAEAVRAPAVRLVASIGLTGGALGVAAALARLHAQSYATFGLDEPLRFEHLATIAFETAWGRGWAFQALAASAALAIMWWQRARMSHAQGFVAALLVATVASVPLTSHAVSDDLRALALPLQMAHVFGAGVWLGGLAGLVVAIVSVVGGRDRTRELAALVETFSPFALLGAGLVAASGILTSFVYVESLEALWTTSYGVALGLKVLVFGGVAAIGAYNWLRLKPMLSSNDAAAVRLRRTAIVELALAAVVLVVTAWLTGLPRPGEGG